MKIKRFVSALTTLFYIFSSTSFAFETISQKKSLEEKISNLKFSNKPTLRAFMAFAISGFSQSEINDILNFTKQQNINLDEPVDLTFQNEKVFLHQKEVTYNLKENTFTYSGIKISPSGKSSVLLMREIYSNLNRQNPTKTSLFLDLMQPNAKAKQKDRFGQFLENTAWAGGASTVLGLILAAAGDTHKIKALELIGSRLLWGGLAVGAIGVLAGLLYPNDIADGELMRIDSASCDSDAIMVRSKNRHIKLKLASEDKITIQSDSTIHPIEFSVLLNTESEKALKSQLQKCKKYRAEDFTVELQNAINQGYAMMSVQAQATNAPSVIQKEKISTPGLPN